MAIMKVGPIAIISGLALAGVGVAATLVARDGKPTVTTESAAVGSSAPAPIARADESADAERMIVAETLDTGGENAPAPRFAPASIDFSIGSIDDLRRDRLSTPLEKIESVAGVAVETKVWVATADVASASGVETFYHLKGPLTCGRIGCDLILVSASKAVLLETIAEGVSSPQIDTLIVNQGTDAAVTWVFNGSEFEERR